MNKPVYLFQGKQVVIVDLDTLPEGLPTLETSNVYALVLVEEAEKAGITEYFLTYDDCYSEYSGEIPIVLESVVNIENEQKLMYEFVTEPYFKDDLLQRELFTSTTRFHDWTSERTMFIESHTESDSTKEEAKKEWDEIVSRFIQGFAVSPHDVNFDDIWDDIEYRRQ